MIKCGITGSSGVLGRRIIKLLPYKFYKFTEDITDINEVKKWVAKYNLDILIHLAAKVPAKRVSKDYKNSYNVNVNGTLNLIDSLIEKKIKQFSSRKSKFTFFKMLNFALESLIFYTGYFKKKNDFKIIETVKW